MPDRMPYVTIGRGANLLPNFDPVEVASGGKPSVMASVDDLTDVGSILATAICGKGTITVTTAGNAADSAVLTLGGFVSTFVSPGGSTTAIATALAAHINRSYPHVRATSATNVVTVVAAYPGILGNFAFTSVETGTIDLTAVALSGGTGEIITPLEHIVVQVGKQTFDLRPGRTIRANKLIRDAVVNSGRYFS